MQPPTITRPRRRALATVTALVAVAAGLLVGVASPASATPYATAMTQTQRMSQPTLNSTQYGWYAKGQSLDLSCYQYGQSVKGYYSPWISGGWDSLWYRTSDGGWVADVDINTGSNNPVTGACSQPAPSSSLSTKVDNFVNQYNGKYVDYDGAYGAQCVDLFNFYNRDVVGAGAVPATYAYQLYNNAPASNYDKLPASATPQKGDVAVWSSNLPYSGGAGHVAIVLSGGGSTIHVFEQNVYLSASQPNSPSIVRDQSTQYLIGYLRPKV